MNIEEKIRNNRDAFEEVKMPEGSRERFEKRLRDAGLRDTRPERFPRYARNDRKVRLMTWTSVAAAAAVALFVIIHGIKIEVVENGQSPQIADNKLVEMRQMYDERVDEAIFNLEEVMKNVDDSTRMQINAVIDGLLNMGDVFAELAPLPEEKQMAIAEQIYDNKLRTIELITDKINK